MIKKLFHKNKKGDDTVHDPGNDNAAVQHVPSTTTNVPATVTPPQPQPQPQPQQGQSQSQSQSQHAGDHPGYHSDHRTSNAGSDGQPYPHTDEGVRQRDTRDRMAEKLPHFITHPFKSGQSHRCKNVLTLAEVIERDKRARETQAHDYSATTGQPAAVDSTTTGFIAPPAGESEQQQQQQQQGQPVVV